MIRPPPAAPTPSSSRAVETAGDGRSRALVRDDPAFLGLPCAWLAACCRSRGKPVLPWVVAMGSCDRVAEPLPMFVGERGKHGGEVGLFFRAEVLGLVEELDLKC